MKLCNQWWFLQWAHPDENAIKNPLGLRIMFLSINVDDDLNE